MAKKPQARKPEVLFFNQGCLQFMEGDHLLLFRSSEEVIAAKETGVAAALGERELTDEHARFLNQLGKKRGRNFVVHVIQPDNGKQSAAFRAAVRATIGCVCEFDVIIRRGPSMKDDLGDVLWSQVATSPSR